MQFTSLNATATSPARLPQPQPSPPTLSPPLSFGSLGAIPPQNTTRDRITFGGKANKKPSLWQRIRNFFKSLFSLKKLAALFPNSPEKLLKPSLPKIQALLDEPRPARIESTFKRPTTGIAKAQNTLTPDAEFVQNYADWHFLNVQEKYDVSWDRMKVVRDALQNFYDGQGQTLGDVELKTQTRADGKHEVHIAASATYDAEKLISIGGTGKKDNDITAGGYGEGAKIMALVLLRDYGAETVRFRSGNWQLEFKLDTKGKNFSGDASNRGLMAKLTLLDNPIDGNDLTIVTDDEALKTEFESGKSLFYHAKDEEFSNPFYENALGGIKFSTEPQGTRFFYAGQHRAINTSSDRKKDPPNMTVWTHEKFLDDVQRDRGSMTPEDVTNALQRISRNMSVDDAIQCLNVMKPQWFHIEDRKPSSAERILFESALDRIEAALQGKDAQAVKERLKFPENLIAMNLYDEKQVEKVQAEGKIPVVAAMAQAGVPALQASKTTITRTEQTEEAPPPISAKAQHRAELVQELFQEIESDPALAGVSRLLSPYNAQTLREAPITVVPSKQLPTYMPLSVYSYSAKVREDFIETASFETMLARLLNETQHYKVDTTTLIQALLDTNPGFQDIKARWNSGPAS